MRGAPGRAGETGNEAGSAFAEGLYALAELARERGGLPGALRSDDAVRTLESACRAPGARRGAAAAGLPDHLAFVEHLARTLRPLSLDWYTEDALGAADLCHAAAGGTTALPGLLAKRFFGTPLLVTEYGVQLRSHYLSTAGTDRSAPLRTLLAALHGRLRRRGLRAGRPPHPRQRPRPPLAGEVRRRPRPAPHGPPRHGRRPLRRGGRGRGERRPRHPRLGRPGRTRQGPHRPAARLRRDPRPAARRPAEDRRRPGTGPRLRRLPRPHQGARRAALPRRGPCGAHAVGENPVTFEELGGPEAPTLEDTYASGAVVVLSSVVEGFPTSLVEAMFCARATVSTDVGAVVEIIGGTGLVVPPRNPRALADACLALLREPERRHRLGAAARARALELFTVEQNLAAFRGIYLELLSHAPVRHRPGDGVPFAHPAEAHVPGSWAHKAVAAGTGAPDA